MCFLPGIIVVQTFLNIIRHIAPAAGIAGIHKNHFLRLTSSQICFQLILLEKIICYDRLRTGFGNGFHIFFQRIISAKQGGTNLLCPQKQIHEFRNRTQEYRNLIILSKSQCTQRASCRFCILKYFPPENIRSVIMHRRDLISRAIHFQIFIDCTLRYL